MFPILNWFFVFLILITSTSLMLFRDWRWVLGSLALQYVGVFWLTLIHWPLSMAAVKLVTGWMSCTILGMVLLYFEDDPDAELTWPQSRFFHLAAALVIWVVSLTLAFRVAAWLGIDISVTLGGLILMGNGMLMLGMTTQPLRVVIGLLVLLSGFEIIYAAIENSALVAALLTIVTLGLALTGAYLMTPQVEEKPE